MVINRSIKTSIAYFWFLDRNSQEKNVDWKSLKRSIGKINSSRWIPIKHKNLRYGNKIITWLNW